MMDEMIMRGVRRRERLGSLLSFCWLLWRRRKMFQALAMCVFFSLSDSLSLEVGEGEWDALMRGGFLEG